MPTFFQCVHLLQIHILWDSIFWTLRRLIAREVNKRLWIENSCQRYSPHWPIFLHGVLSKHISIRTSKPCPASCLSTLKVYLHLVCENPPGLVHLPQAGIGRRYIPISQHPLFKSEERVL